MTEPTIRVPMPIAARSLTAAGLASWVLASAGRHDDAARCATFQDVVDAALHAGEQLAVAVPRAVAEEAVLLWDAAADLLDRTAGAEAARGAERLRTRSTRLRGLLAAGTG